MVWVKKKKDGKEGSRRVRSTRGNTKVVRKRREKEKKKEKKKREREGEKESVEKGSEQVLTCEHGERWREDQKKEKIESGKYRVKGGF